MRRVLEDLLDAGHARHAVADHDEALHRSLLEPGFGIRGRS